MRAANTAAHRRHRARLKQQVVAAYGGECSCCGEGELEFLTLDHVGGRATTDTARGHRMYLQAKREGFPATYRLLCWNCNCARQHNGGVCPHERAREEAV
jgi:hypothetical protein